VPRIPVAGALLLFYPADIVPVAEGVSVTTGEGDFAGTGVECVPPGDAELVGLVPVVGFGVVVGGDVVGTVAGEPEDGAVAGVTPIGAAGGGLTSR
jgi:hypothetical protein